MLPFIYIITLIGFTHAASPWTLAGLKNEKINTILHMSNFGGNALMAGTDNGIYWYQEGEWDTVWKGLPVHDLKLLPTGEPIAAVGNGSDSDGIYIGYIAAIAKRRVGGDGMNTWWGFALLQKYPMPKAVAFSPLDGRCAGKIYVGNNDGVASGMFCNRTLAVLTKLPWSEQQFTIRCATMINYSVDGRVYIGSNKRAANGTFTEKEDSSWLLRGTTELTRFKRLDVTSLAEYTTQRDILINGAASAIKDRDTRLLAVATADSGIRIFEGDYYYSALSAPVRNEPVIAVVPFSKIRSTMGFTLTMLAAATSSGVYLQCSPDMHNQWQELGNLPHSSNCLAQYNGTVLWAGTDSGLYRYELPTYSQWDKKNTVFQPFRVNITNTGFGSLCFSIKGDNRIPYTLELFDMLGKCVKKTNVVNENVVLNRLIKGIYRYRLANGSRVLGSGDVICR
jgi:hypothetical protein